MTLAAGYILHNRYRIVKLVGQGGFGAVYRGWDTALDRPVAVKENFDTGPQSQRQFEREAKLLAGVRHPNLPVVIDHFILPGQGQYLVMDFVEGQNLSALLAERGGPLGEAEVLPWMRQVCDALEYLHTRTPPIIHRDIKPDNIIITAEGRAMLVDFGVSKIYDPSKGTTIGAKAVTPGYSPLEQYGRGKTDPRSDIYSLGATLYTLLTGQVPPEAPDLSSGADVLTPPRRINPTLSAATSAAIVEAMAPNISRRLGSAGGLSTALASASSRSVAPRPRQPARTPPIAPTVSAGGGGASRSSARGNIPLWGWIAGVVALVALAAWAGMAFGGRNGGAAEPEATAVLAAIDTPRATATAKPTMIAQTTIAAQATTIPANTSMPRPSATPQPTRTPPITPTREPQAGDIRVVTRGGVEVEQVFVPAGSFMMGSEDGQEDERRVHEVTLDAFWIDRTEVTNEQYAACVADGVCRPPQANSSYTRPSYYGEPVFADYPVIYVSWEDAVAYAAWAGGRLPTEAEWEYAARGPESRVYPWGNGFDGEKLNFCDLNCPIGHGSADWDDGHADTAPVGSYPDGASWVGALDMAGNVGEWMNDWYDSETYQNAPAVNPTGPSMGERKALRGGAWLNLDQLTRAAYRNDLSPHYRLNYVGFRVVEHLSDSGF